MYLLFFAFLIAPVLGRSLEDSPCPPFTPPGPGFDLSKYLGLWYEIARTDVPYEKGLDCVNATYTLRDDKNITVLNQGKNLQTKVVSVLQGVGRVTSQANLLEVRFSPQTPEAPYWIVDTDFYSYSVVYSCADVGKFVYRGAYILSRFPVMIDTLREKLTDKLVDLGVKREDLKQTEQLKCLLP